MPKPTKGPRLGGSPAHQRHIIANLCKDLIRHGAVTTTQTRAKTVQPHIERLISKAKRGDTYNRRLALRVLQDRELAYILFEELGPKFAERNGGFTRIIKLGNRKGDNAAIARIELVTEKVSPKQSAVREAEKAAKKAAEAQKLAKEAKASADAEKAAETAADAVESKEADGAAKETAAKNDAAAKGKAEADEAK